MDLQFEIDFRASAREAEEIYEHGTEGMNTRVLSILTEMVFQLGKNGVRKFKKMLRAITIKDYQEASVQMIDSKWARQTPERAKRLAKMMAEIV